MNTADLEHVMLPDFVIIGAMKAASTLITECLRQHPEVYMPRGETPYFRDPEYSWSGIEIVENIFTGQPAGRRLGIKSPDYLGEPCCARRIHDDLDEPQLICVLRDPVDRAVSAYYWAMKWGILPIAPIEAGMGALLDSGGTDHPVGYAQVIDWGFYGKHLQRYVDLWPSEKILVQLNEDYRADGLSAIREVFDHLGIDRTLEPKALGAVQNAGIYSLERLMFLNRRNKYAVKWAPDRSWVKLGRPTRPFQFAYNAAVVLTDRWVLSRRYGSTKPKISHDLERRLYGIYAEDVAHASKLLGRGLSSWSARGTQGRTAQL